MADAPEHVEADLSPDGLARAVACHWRQQAVSWTRLRGGRVVDLGDVVVFVSGAPVRYANGMVGARMAPQDADCLIEEALDQLRAAGVPGSWSVGPGSEPADLGERLLRHGFEFEQSMPWLAAGLEELDLDAPPPDGLEIREVTDAATHDAWVRAMRLGFGMLDTEVALLSEVGERARAEPDPRWLRFAAWYRGRVVASSGLVLEGGVAAIYNVATDPAERRRGIGTAMTLAALRRGRDLGYRVAVLGTSDAGRGVYERIGFREACRHDVYVWAPEAEGARR
jgi:ribosomal protein S18 acetylase RimI-like enzyme